MPKALIETCPLPFGLSLYVLGCSTLGTKLEQYNNLSFMHSNENN